MMTDGAGAGMQAALREARASAARGEIPVGAAIVAPDGSVMVATGNRVRELNDPTAHAEILAIRSACQAAASDRLPGHALYTTLEPCPMCAAAISLARIERLFYGASDKKSGGIEHGARIFDHPQCHHVPQIYAGIREDECADLMVRFFRRLRAAPRDGR